MANVLSQETRIKSGVLLFVLFVDDLPRVITLTTLLFAYDVKVVGKSLSIPLNSTTSLLDGLFHFNFPLPLEVRAIPYRSQTLLKAWADAVYDKAIVR